MRYQVRKNHVGVDRLRQECRNAERQSVGAPHEAAEILDDEGETEGQQQAVNGIAIVHPADHQPLDDEAEHPRQQRGDHERAPEADIGRQHEGKIATECQKIAVREIDDVAEVEDQGEAQRHQHVERAEDQPVGDVEQDELQHRPPSSGGSSREHVAPPRPSAATAQRPFGSAQAGWTILQPDSETGPAAVSPGTSCCSVNTSSGLLVGGCTSPTKILGISSWSPAR